MPPAAAAPMVDLWRPELEGRVGERLASLGDQLDDRRVQLVFVPLRGRAAFQVTHVAVVFGYDEGPFELTEIL